MTWAYEDPVAVTFGVGVLGRIGELIDGRRYCLVTYAEPLFAALAERVAGRADPAVVSIDSVTPNPDFAGLTGACWKLRAATARPQVVVGRCHLD